MAGGARAGAIVGTKRPVKPFHITRIQPADYPHAHAVAEAVAYLHASLGACGEAVTQADNTIDGGAINIVACAHLLDAGHAAALPPDTIIFNSERLVPPTDWPLASPVYRGLLARHRVWDYSARNIRELGHARASVIPFWTCAALAPGVAREPGDELLFYGVITPRRAALLDAVAARGLAVTAVFGEYGPVRDARIDRALAVINLHKTDDDALFEPIRCFYPLLRGCPVISEPSTDPTAAAYDDAIAWARTAAFADDVAALLADRARFLAVAARQVAAFRALDPTATIAAAVARVRNDAVATEG